MSVAVKRLIAQSEDGLENDDPSPAQPMRPLIRRPGLWLALIATSILVAATVDVNAATRKFRNAKDCDTEMGATFDRFTKEIENLKVPTGGDRQFCTYRKREVAMYERQLEETKAFKGSVCWQPFFDKALADDEASLTQVKAKAAEVCAKADAADGKTAAAAETQPRPTFRNKKECGDKYLAMLLRHATAVGGIVAKIPKPGAETRDFCAYQKTLNAQVERNLAEEKTFKGSVCWDASNDQSLAASEKKLADSRTAEEKTCADVRTEKTQPKTIEQEVRAAAQNKNGPLDQRSQNLIWCSTNDNISPDLRIGGCTNVIQSGRGTPEALAEAFYNRGVGYFSKNDMAKALEDYDQSIKLDPTMPVPYNNRGYIYFSQQQHARAIQDFDNAIQRDPKYAVAFLNRGQAYVGLKQFSRAIRDYDDAIGINRTEFAYRLRGVANQQKGEYGRAIADFDQAINLDPKSSGAFLLRGACHEALGDGTRAVEDYGKSIELNPNYSSAFGMRGILYSKQKKYDLAVKDFSAALKLDPGEAVTFRVRGVAYMDLSQNELAVQDFTSAIRLEPSHSGTFSLRGTAHAHSGQFDRAIQDFNRALEISPNDANTLNQRSYTKAKMGDEAGAKIDRDAARKIDPSIR